MKRNGESTAWEFRVSGHSLSNPNAPFDFIVVIDPLRRNLGSDKKMVVLDPDLDWIADDHYARHMPASDSDISDVVGLNNKTEVCRTRREFYQFGTSIGLFSGVGEGARPNQSYACC